MTLVFNYWFLLIGFIFTFFIFGFIIIETFFEDFPLIQKIPLYFLLSVLVSTYAVYFSSLIIGYSKLTIFLVFLIAIPWILTMYLKKRKAHFFLSKEHAIGIIISLLVAIIFFIALYPAIFYRYDNYFVMSADNWQDTPMHLGIIESISQGNFPPQAPYFSGKPLNYYYFTDLHTAILQSLVGKFMPRLLVVDNPFFVMIFSLSLYVFGYYLSRNRSVAILSAFLGVFSGNFMFARFFYDLVKINQNFLLSVRALLASGAYTMEFAKLMQIPPITDQFLQNRPMMIGLPGVVLVSFLVLKGYQEKSDKSLFLAGVIAGMLIKFQLFAYGISLLTFLLISLIFSQKKQYQLAFKQLLTFIVPFVTFSILVVLTTTDNNLILTMIKNNFTLNPEIRTHGFYWNLKFIFANIGVLFILPIAIIPMFILRKINFNQSTLFLLLWFVILMLLPYTIGLTLFDYDMYKFFYFMMIPASIIAGFSLNKIKSIRFGYLIVAIILFISSLTPILTLTASYLNRNMAYSDEDYTTGIWIRNNTPSKSVFVSLPTIHSPIDQIGGRLKVLSYINWPYSHGFNEGEDNVFSRREEIENLYRNSNNDSNILNTMNKYKATYVFYGREEQSQFPQAEFNLDSSNYLRLVYNSDSTKIYEF